ncbi:TPA: hypothetical protein ACQZK0_004893 [Enterobacter mori]
MSSENAYNLIVGKGESVIEGKTHWKDFVQVQIDDPQEAFSLAMSILRQLENQNFSGKHPINFNLTGSLEVDADD